MGFPPKCNSISSCQFCQWCNTLVVEPRTLSQEKTSKTEGPTANFQDVTVLEALLTPKTCHLVAEERRKAKEDMALEAARKLAQSNFAITASICYLVNKLDSK